MIVNIVMNSNFKAHLQHLYKNTTKQHSYLLISHLGFYSSGYTATYIILWKKKREFQVIVVLTKSALKYFVVNDNYCLDYIMTGISNQSRLMKFVLTWNFTLLWSLTAYMFI